MLFLIQRADARRFSLARDIDAAYGAAFDMAMAAGVEALALRCRLSETGIEVDRSVRITGSAQKYRPSAGKARQCEPS
jgi:sugar fermentation stimulation protein A